MPWYVLGTSAGAAAETISWIRSPIARSSGGILARLSCRSCRPSARSSSGVRADEAFRSRAVAATAARSSSLKTLSSLRLSYLLLVGISNSFRGSCRSSGRRGRRGRLALEDPDRVAERIAEAHVGPVEVVDGLLGEVADAPLLERLVEGVDVVGVEDEAVEGALGDQLAELVGGRLVVERRARLLERDLDVGVARDADGQPAVVALLEVRALLQAQLVDV